MELDEKLRVLILKEYGFSEAIKDNTISDNDLLLIQQTTQCDIIQNEITNIFKKRMHEKIIFNVEKYKGFQYLKGFAAARARLLYKANLEELLSLERYITNTDKQLVKHLLAQK
jgi:hypothetical protein